MDSVRPGDRVLDAGCGLGQWAMLLNDYGVPAVGLDFSERMLETLRRRAPHIDWISGRIQAIPAESERFDAVLSWGVIEHDEAGPQAALVEFRRVLKPGGRLLVTVPIDTRGTRRFAEVERGPAPEATEFYQYFFRPDELRDELTRAGFVVTAVRACSKHYGVAFPRVYARLPRQHLLDALVALFMRPIVARRADAYLMLLGTAIKAF